MIHHVNVKHTREEGRRGILRAGSHTIKKRGDKNNKEQETTWTTTTAERRIKHLECKYKRKWPPENTAQLVMCALFSMCFDVCNPRGLHASCVSRVCRAMLDPRLFFIHVCCGAAAIICRHVLLIRWTIYIHMKFCKKRKSVVLEKMSTEWDMQDVKVKLFGRGLIQN